MAVFPEQMNRLDPNDVQGSLKLLENYVRYMTERMEFANSNTFNTINASGGSNASLYKAIITQADNLAVLQANVNGMSNAITTLSSQVADLAARVTGEYLGVLDATLE